MQNYAREYVRLSLLGVNNINSLTDCSKILPAATKTWSNPDQSNMNIWLNSDDNSAQAKTISDNLNNGASISSIILKLVNSKLQINH